MRAPHVHTFECLSTAGEDKGAINGLDRAHSARWSQVLLQQVRTMCISRENPNDLPARDIHCMCPAGCSASALVQGVTCDCSSADVIADHMNHCATMWLSTCAPKQDDQGVQVDGARGVEACAGGQGGRCSCARRQARGAGRQGGGAGSRAGVARGSQCLHALRCPGQLGQHLAPGSC
jgi:hypothetical protein